MMNRGQKRGLLEETGDNVNPRDLGQELTVQELKTKLVKLVEGLQEEDTGCTNTRSVVGGLAEEVPSQPLLWVEGLGRVGLPLTPATAGTLQAAMKRAPYGLGEATLLNTQVRDSWQLGPDRFRLENKAFVEAVEGGLVERVRVELGLEQVEVRAELYKLLLYNPGGHFKAHRDTEKAEGMFGTLILQLPSEFAGGELVVRHGGEEATVAMAREGAATSCVFAAHYSDCEHELREVTSGHRLAVVYSLCRRGAGTAPAFRPLPAALGEVAGVVAALGRLEGGQRFCWAFQHMYSQKSLAEGGLAALKGEDRKVADLLVEAARRVTEVGGVEVYLAQASRLEEQYGDCTRGQRDGWGRGGRGGRGQKSRGGGKKNFGNCFEYCDTSEESEQLANFVHLNRGGGSHAIPALSHKEGVTIEVEEEVINYQGAGGSKQRRRWWGEGEGGECSGPSGNEGATRDMWYRRAVLVLWREGAPVLVAARQGVQAALVQVQATLARGGEEEAGGELRQLLQHVRDTGDCAESQEVAILDLAVKLGEVELAQEVIAMFMQLVLFSLPTVEYAPKHPFVTVLRSCITRFGWSAMRACLLDTFQDATAADVGHLAKVLTGFVTTKEPLAGRVLKLMEARLKEVEDLKAATAEDSAQQAGGSLNVQVEVEEEEEEEAWRQKEAVVPGEPEVEGFFRGPEEAYRREGFAGIGEVSLHSFSSSLLPSPTGQEVGDRHGQFHAGAAGEVRGVSGAHQCCFEA